MIRTEELHERFENLTCPVVALIVLIVVSLVYFGVSLLMLKIVSDALFGPELYANLAVLTAAQVFIASKEALCTSKLIQNHLFGFDS